MRRNGNGIRFLGGRIFPLISLKNPVESGVWCAEAPGIQGLVGVGGVHSTQNAIGATQNAIGADEAL